MIFLIFLIFSYHLCGIEKRGFIAKDEEGRLFLMECPNVRSCCVGKKIKGIELIGDFSGYSLYGAVTVKGELVETLDGLKLIQDGFTVENLLSEKVPSD